MCSFTIGYSLKRGDRYKDFSGSRYKTNAKKKSIFKSLSHSKRPDSALFGRTHENHMSGLIQTPGHPTRREASYRKRRPTEVTDTMIEVNVIRNIRIT